MKKIYKKLTKEQKERKVIFSSCLSECREEMEDSTIHEVFKDWNTEEQDKHIKNLLDDRFFNGSHFNFNIIRR